MNNQQTVSIEEYIRENGQIIQTSVGRSMYPMLRSRKDNVIIEKITRPLKKYDVPLYITKDNKYVLHRIIKIKNGKYVIRGDNTYVKEYGITDENIIGVLKGFYRGDKYHSVTDKSYKAYVRLNIATYFLRYVYHFCKRVLYKIFRVFFRKKKGNSNE